MATVVLKSSLIQGIDYYIINARVWNYFYNSYGCDVCLKLSPYAIKRMPSYSNKDTEIEVNNEGDLMLLLIMIKYLQIQLMMYLMDLIVHLSQQFILVYYVEMILFSVANIVIDVIIVV